MSKRKLGPMRQKTKEALIKLSEIMISKYKLEDIKGTPDFLEFAIREGEKAGLDISWQTIRMREQFLEMRCDELYKDLKTKQAENEKCDDTASDVDMALYDELGFEVDDSLIIEIAISKMRKILESTKITQVKKYYSKFYYDANGSLCWGKGALGNCVVGTPGIGYYNNANRWVNEKTHAAWMISSDNPLFRVNSYTKDDMELLKKLAGKNELQ